MPDPLADPQNLAEQLLAHLRAHQSEWRDRYHLQRMGLLGSTARNEAAGILMRGSNSILSPPSPRCT